MRPLILQGTNVRRDGKPIGVVLSSEWKFDKLAGHDVCFATIKLALCSEGSSMATGMSVLESKTTEAACRAWGVTMADYEGRDAGAASEGDNKGVDWTSLLAFAKALAETIASLMGNCPNAPKAALVRSLRSPNWLQKVRFKADLRNRCATCVSPDAKAKFDDGGDIALSLAGQLTVAEAEALVDECRAPIIDHSV